MYTMNNIYIHINYVYDDYVSKNCFLPGKGARTGLQLVWLLYGYGLHDHCHDNHHHLADEDCWDSRIFTNTHRCRKNDCLPLHLSTAVLLDVSSASCPCAFFRNTGEMWIKWYCSSWSHRVLLDLSHTSGMKLPT